MSVIKFYADPVLDPENELPLPIPQAERPYITLVKHGTDQESWVVELPDPESSSGPASV